MSDIKISKEELKKIEDEAYFELCQIIAEAMQYQDITLLDQRILDWKKKYKKLLDSNSSASTNFKKRIEYLLNEYYSEITQYILKQIRKTEQKRIENQSKVLRKLYYIIKETDDLALLKKKVKEWEDKYPISGFLNMYQKRIKIYTSENYLKEHAFDQDIAFRDLYYITKLNRTYNEFKEEISNWEDKYSIHDKFELDDFIKHQSDVNRYTSDEYLQSIAHADNNENQEFALPEEKFADSSLPKQATAYSSLMSVARKPNNIDEIFNWVYKYNSIKFNDEYKNLILSDSAIYLDYSPTYLNSLSVPKINLSSSLTFDEYQNIDEIKRYTVISYFNLLLPPEEAISNNYFNEYIEKIYRKSRTSQFYKDYNQTTINLEKNNELKTVPTKEKIPELEIDISNGQTFNIPNDINVPENASKKLANTTVEEPQTFTPEGTQTIKETISSEKSTAEEQIQCVVTAKDTPIIKETSKQIEADSLIETAVVKSENKKSVSEKDEKVDSLVINEIATKRPQEKSSVVTDEPKLIIPEVNVKSQPEDLIVPEKDSEISVSEFEKSLEKPDILTSKESQEFKKESEPLSSDTIIAISPLFFELMNNKVTEQKQQATIVTMINSHVEDYMSSITPDKTNDISKTINDSN